MDFDMITWPPNAILRAFATANDDLPVVTEWGPLPEDQTDDDILAESEVRTDTVPPNAVAALHGLLDAPGAPPALGDPLPPLWHWLAFLPNAPQRELGNDGHPAAGSFTPVDRPPRRMFAGGRLTFERVVPIGTILTRHSRAASISTKEGRSGTLVFVEIDHEISTRDGSRISDVQDVVYRHAETIRESPTAALLETASDDDWEWTFALDPSATLLFRFFGTDLQRASHPLRRAVRERGRGLSKSPGAWTAPGHRSRRDLSQEHAP